MKYQIALDIGATKILGGVVKGKQVIKKIKKPTNSKSGRKNILDNIANTIKYLQADNGLKRGKLTKIGIGIAAQVNPDKGVVLSTTNFDKSFNNVKLAQILNTQFKVPVKIDNDVKCFTKAEIKYGAGRGLQDVVGLTLGTGIGGGIVMGGQFWRGSDNAAGEFGHMKIAGQWIGTPPLCGSGHKYCWESIASGRAWQRLYKKYNKHKADEIIVHNIVTGLLNICYILNPASIILGGGLMEHPDILPKIKKEFNMRAGKPWFKKVKIVTAKLGDDAILFGALI